MQSNPIVVVPVEMALETALCIGQKVQFLYSERMQDVLMSILTVEQIAELVAAKVAPRPLVFPMLVVN
jgi:hypothetical protein